MDWTDNDQLFRREYETGTFWTEQVARYLRFHGFAVVVTPRSFRTHYGETDEYSKQVSLTCDGVPVDVKSRDLVFTGPGDFPYNDVFINTVRSFRAKTTKPDFMVVVSQHTGAMIVLDVQATVGEWKIHHDFDKVREIPNDFAVADKGCWFAAHLWVADLRKRKAQARGLPRLGA